GREPATFMFSRLGEGDPREAASERLAGNYFAIHRRLMSDHLMSFDEARQFLSYSSFILALALEQRMSASEISRVLASRDQRYQFRWRPVRHLLEQTGSAAVIEADAFREVFAQHATAESELLSDFTLEEGLEHVARLALALGCPDNIESGLRTLLINEVHEPYICILHYQLMVLSFCDHAVSYAYEFSPRGQNADFLTGRYNEAGITVAKSAYLNNAKALLRFDRGWADGRSDHRRAATALSSILNALESMGAMAKAELARFLLALLHRNLRIAEEEGQGLPLCLTALDAPSLDRLLIAVAANGSGTSGLIEQRLVDCHAASAHSDQWSSRGLGDSVFAANLFRKKLGDVEYMNVRAAPAKVVAYESHGGHLTELYVQDHFDTFFQVLCARAEELETVAPLPEWSLAVVFVAHSFVGNLPKEVSARVGDAEIRVCVRYMTFAELAEKLREDGNRLQIVDRLLVEPLNQIHIHRRIRRRVVELADLH
ncbi:MAG: hypothetical protein ACREB5_04340, partial [Sphingomonadaceae bacterium]